jgi:hypothetical protein
MPQCLPRCLEAHASHADAPHIPPAMCVCCSSELNSAMAENMSMSLLSRFAKSSNLRKTARSSISKGCRVGGQGMVVGHVWY